MIEIGPNLTILIGIVACLAVAAVIAVFGKMG